MSPPNLPPKPFSLPDVPRPQLGSRALFPSLRAHAYLAHAAISPLSQAAMGALQKANEIVAELGVGSFPLYMAQRERTRASLAALLNVEGESICLTPGCTRGITDVALSFPWKSGDVLLGFDGEFPANVGPWKIATERRGAKIRLLRKPDPRKEDAASLVLSELSDAYEEESITGVVRGVAVSAVQFQTGMAMPLKEISKFCEERGLLLLVDAIQGCGVMPFDLKEVPVDGFFVGAHKWLLGLEGAGFCYLSKRLLSALEPQTAGWLSYEDGEKFLFQGAGLLKYDSPLIRDARVFEGSTANAHGFVALEAGVDLCALLGPSAIFSHVQSYHDRIEGPLVERGFRSLRARDSSLRSCLLSFVPRAGIGIAELAGGLRQQGIIVSTPDGLLRLAPHYSNNVEEIPQVLAAFDNILS